MSDKVALKKGEENAVFLAVNKVDIFKVRGTEFYHFYLIIQIRNPNLLEPYFPKRTALFYSAATRNLPEQEVIYFDSFGWQEQNLWETTISASSECAYDKNEKKLGRLIKVPNYDRMGDPHSGNRVFVKKIAINDMVSIKKILLFEEGYNDSLKYALIPEIKQTGYNSNSYCRGVLEYVGLSSALEDAACFKSPGLSKSVQLVIRE